MPVKHTILAAAVAALLACNAAAQTTPATEPWMNRALPAEQRAGLALGAMTQEEKLKLVFGYFAIDIADKGYQRPQASRPQSAGWVPGVPRLGIPDLFETDAGIGVASQRGPKPRQRTALPSGLATAATWNPELAYQGGAMIGAEARASGFNVMLAGGINLTREPRNGRNFEYAGEDPWLAATMVSAQIRGVQSNHVISTIKHLSANDQETSRMGVNVKMSDRDARRSDLLAFQLAIEQSNPGSVMCAYNRYNDFYACESDYLMNQVLKQDWQFKGFVMSDWGATHSTIPAAMAGLDQQSGWPLDKHQYFTAGLQEAVANGHVPQARLDDMVRRILWAMFDKGVVDHPVAEGGPIDAQRHEAISQADAEQGMVLLKNDAAPQGGKLLPLAPGLKRIAVIGSHADIGVLSGGGSSQVYPRGELPLPGLGPNEFPGPLVWFPSSPLKALKERHQATFTFDAGRDPDSAARAAAGADVVIVFANQWTAESLDASLDLAERQNDVIAAVARANPRTVVVLETGGPVLMPWLAQVPAVLQAWYPGTSGGPAIARVLTGEVDAAGRLPLTFPASLDQLPHPQLPGQGKGPEDRWDLTYPEGAAVGYKWYDLKDRKPLFPFGHGLSYGEVKLEGLGARLDGKTLKVTFRMTNHGQRAASQVGQVYVAAPRGRWEAPKRLANFAKASLKPGESRSFELAVDPRLLADWDSRGKTWKIAAGSYQVLLARSAGDIVARVPVKLRARTMDLHGR
ncbi:beta-glucosidase family protein [Pseudoduganella lutea]|uniref:Beta-glucosidase n=1 Tax=Pseudoduganella lutea TaxID=321985 RepID=A0A4P6KTI0_9BURK|nr:beta-glucosidase [Pseudoduganella lutea]QBE61865.1 beta-glucosidase [Pseudoduganella lutea]